MKKANGTMTKRNSNGEIAHQVKGQIDKHLSQGKAKLMWLERQVAEKKTKLNSLKKKFAEYEEKAVSYTQENPKKALAMASAAGVLVTAMWSSLRGKK